MPDSDIRHVQQNGGDGKMITSGRRKSRFIIKQYATGYLFLLPSFIGFLIFMFIPMIASFFLSFTNYDGLSKIKLVGITNYLELLSDDTFRISLSNNLLYTAVTIPVGIVIALFIAISLNKNLPGTKLLRTFYFFPFITSWVAVSIIWKALFDPTIGPINSFLMSIGISNPPQWLASTACAMPAIIITAIWKNAGYNMIILIAGLQTIPEELYEAVEIDGANGKQKFFNVTLPMLSPVMFFVTIISIISSFKVFDPVLVMTNGGPARATNVLVYDIYQEGFQFFKMGYASAIAFVLFIIIMIITLIQFRGQKKWVD